MNPKEKPKAKPKDQKEPAEKTKETSKEHSKENKKGKKGKDPVTPQTPKIITADNILEDKEGTKFFHQYKQKSIRYEKPPFREFFKI